LDHVFLNDELAICDQIVTEIRAVLIRKFQWEDSEVGEVSTNTYPERLIFE
jgi:hypothetical protein